MLHAKQAVFGIYNNRQAVEQAVEQLKSDNFKKAEISVLLPQNERVKELVHVQDSRVVEGIEVGASAGAVVGGVLGWLVGAGVLAVPGIGPVIAAGPIVTTLLAVGTIAGMGGVWGGLIGLGIPEKEAKHYEGRIHKGDILLSVHCTEPERMMKAKEIMIHTGAEDVYSSRPNAVLEKVS